MNGKKTLDGFGNAITFKQIIQLNDRERQNEKEREGKTRKNIHTECSRLASVRNELVGIAVYVCVHIIS